MTDSITHSEKTKPPSFSKSDIVPVVFFGLSVFLVVRPMAILAVLSFFLYRNYGFSANIEGFELLRFLAISLLPFGFNLVFGAFFGLQYMRHLARRQRINSLLFKVFFPNPALLGMLVWWAMFNLPLFLTGDPVKGLAFPSWPPAGMYQPVRNELQLFFFMGNNALPAGFVGTIGLARLWTHIQPGPQTAGGG